MELRYILEVKLEVGGNYFNVGGERKRSVKNDFMVFYLSYWQMMVLLFVIKKIEEGQVEGECLVLDMVIEMFVRCLNGCVKQAIG